MVENPHPSAAACKDHGLFHVPLLGRNVQAVSRTGSKYTKRNVTEVVGEH